MPYLGGAGTGDCDGITLDKAGDILPGLPLRLVEFSAPNRKGRAPLPRRYGCGALEESRLARAESCGPRVLAVANGTPPAISKSGEMDLCNVLGQTESADFPTAADRLAEVRPAEVRPAEVRLDEVRLDEVRVARVRNDCGVFLPPFIPALRSLLQLADVVGVGHSGHDIKPGTIAVRWPVSSHPRCLAVDGGFRQPGTTR